VSSIATSKIESAPAAEWRQCFALSYIRLRSPQADSRGVPRVPSEKAARFRTLDYRGCGTIRI
jgi:hypothetical protein